VVEFGVRNSDFASIRFAVIPMALFVFIPMLSKPEHRA
jgi:hypothetical protein